MSNKDYFKEYFQDNGLKATKSLTPSLPDDLDDQFGLAPLIGFDWKTKPKKLLVVIESVDRFDLKDRRLLSTSTNERGQQNSVMTHLIPSLLDASFQLYERSCKVRREKADSREDYAVAVTNFNQCRTYTLSESKQKYAHRLFAENIEKQILRLQPTHVLVLGDTANRNMLEHLGSKYASYSELRRGWVMKASTRDKSHKFLYTPSLDLEYLYNSKGNESDDDETEDDASLSDLLFFVGRNIENLLTGRHTNSLRHLKPGPKFVWKRSDFDALMEKLNTLPEGYLVGFDMEAASLETYSNRIFTMQFAFDNDSAYVVPIEHPKGLKKDDSKLSEEEVAYRKQHLKEFFSKRKNLITLTGVNLMYDLRVLRGQLKINYIYHYIHEVTAGEADLDENLGLMSRNYVKFRIDGKSEFVSYRGLANLLCMYDNDWYKYAEFSKAQRNTIGHLPVDEQMVLEYSAFDAQTARGIAEQQIERSSRMFVRAKIGEKLVQYKPRYLKHLITVMGNTATSISHMEQDGTPVDYEYMKLLASTKNSPLVKEINNVKAELRAYEHTQAVEKRLLAKTGRKSGIFGAAVELFSPAKKDHLAELFFNEMGLPSVSKTDTGNDAIDKIFVAEYKDEHPEVATFENYTKLTKLASTYVKGWIKRIAESVDCSRLSTLRPGFGFFTIISGRLNSFNPSLQQVPSRHKTAKIIKRMFAAPEGCLNVQMDANASEVRWAINLSGDEKYAEAFKLGMDLRKKWVKEQNSNLKKEMKTKGDVHLASVFLFWNQWVSKDHPYRQAIKALVFG